MDDFAKTVVPILIQDELRSSYMDYSMSVIIGRALPDVRDGLKPVHRRILYAMHEMGLRADKKYSKCAGTVGEVLKKYHPHGDSAVYDAMVRMAQPWNLRYLLVDGQGNFGSVDGDPAAAYRYTEARMTKLAEELLVDIDQETVEFSPNFDGVTEEPDVLPARFPNLLVNGAEGIAVGMATKIPPHNLGEIIDACVAVIDRPELELEELLDLVPGPDFPTGGTIYGRQGVRDAYATGRGRVVVRGTADFEDLDGRQAIIITEIPYQVNKAKLLEAIAQLVKDKKIEGISGLRDESDREGMRIVIELKRDAFGEVILNQLYKHTALQQTFGVILLAIVNQRPRILTLKEMLLHYVAHRREVTLRRSRFQLKKARERLHLVDGFLKAIDVIDAVIALIRASATVEDAREGLVRTFGFTEVQAQAILDMRLQRLTGMERQKLLDEKAELLARIAELEAILASEARLMAVVREELVQIKEAYADARRTRFVEDRGELSMHDLVAEEDQIVTVSHLGYIKRCRQDEWRMQRRGGVGKKGMTTREEDWVTSLQVANTHDVLLVFTNKGQVFPLQVYDVPEAGRDAKGKAIINLVPMPEGERVAAVVSVREVGDDDTSLLFVTRRGLIKRTPLGAFKNLRAGGMRASTVEDDDDLLAVRRLDGDTHVMLFSRGGKCIRFELSEVPEYGRGAMGNYGMKLDDDDTVVDVVLAPVDQVPADASDDEASATADDADVAGTGPDESGPLLLTVSENGYGARTSFGVYRLQGRYGKGIVSFGASAKTGQVVGAVLVGPEHQIMLVTDTGRVIRILASSVPTRVGRGSQGVRLMRLDEGERIVDVEPIEETDEDEVDAPAVDEPPAGEE